MSEQITVSQAVAEVNATPVPVDVRPKKWTTEAGPIMNNKVKDAVQAFMRLNNTFTEISGVIGVSESSHTYWSPFGGGIRPEVAVEHDKIAERFSWRVTRENYKDIVEAFKAAEVELRKTIPVVDKRVTPEQKAETDAKWAAQDEARRAEQARIQAEKALSAPQVEPGSVIVRHNAAHNGVEIKFDGKPNEDIRTQLKGAGFKWSPFQKVWYKKLGSYSWASAHRIAGIADVPPMPTTRQSIEEEAESHPDGAYVAAQEEAFTDAQARACGVL